MARQPIAWLQDAIDDYVSTTFRNRSVVRGHYVVNNDAEQTAIAFYYDNAPTCDDSMDVIQAYNALIVEIVLQYTYAVNTIGITFEAWEDADTQPYANSEAMQADVRENKHLFYYTGGETHPLLGEYNNLFRAIHDLFGHASEGYQFGKRGEFNAYLHHSMMFSPLAQAALATETHGQNSWVNYGPYSALPVQSRPFAVQKCFLLPVALRDFSKYVVGF